MPGTRIPNLTAISGANTANDDNLVIFDTSENTTKRILRSQLAAGVVGDLPYTPAGFISATTVPTAIAEIASDLTDTGGAALIGNTPAGTISAGTVQGALDEIVSDLAASDGSSLVGFLQAGANATPRTAQAKMRETVSVKDFGAVGDGVADDTAAIQAALASSIAAEVFFPPGTYNVTACLNNTNGFRRLVGAGPGATTIQSTSTSYIIDCTGTNWGSIENIQLTSTTARVGVYFNRSNIVGFDFSQYNTLKNVYVVLSSTPAANGGLGTVGYYNRSCELNRLENCSFVADRPAILRAVSNSTFLPVYQTEGSIVSMTSNEFDKCVFFSTDTSRPAITADGIASTDFSSCYIGSNSASGSPVPALDMTTVDGCFFRFHVEIYVQLARVRTLSQANEFNCYMMYPSASGSIWLDNGNTALCSFASNRVLIKAGGSYSTSNYGVYSSGQSTANLYVSGNLVQVAGSIGTPMGWVNAPVSSEFNTEISLSYSKVSNTRFAGGNMLPAFGKGIDFSLTSPPSGMSSQLFNDYEEGTWTPNQGAGLTVVGTFSSSGHYTKIGRTVFVRGTITATTSLSFSAAGIICSNFPFAAGASAIGSAANAALDASVVTALGGSILYSCGSMAATTSVAFSITYTV